MRTGGRLAGLDGLRGLAAIGVVFCHLWAGADRTYPSLGAPVPGAIYGRYGVMLFFVISGFVILMSLDRVGTREFAIRRFIRLYPIYWISVALSVATVALFGLPGVETTPIDLLVNLTMLQGFLGFPNIDGSYWTLEIELLFYLQAAVLSALGAFSKRWLPITLYGWGLLFVALRYVVPTDLPVARQVVIHLPTFMIGIVAYAIVMRRERRLAVVLFPLLPLAVQARYVPLDSVLVAAFFVMVVLAAAGRLPIMASAPLRWLGAISYPLYLIHQDVGIVFMREVTAGGVGIWAARIGALVVVLVIATVLNCRVDEPMRAALTRRLIGRRAAAAGGARGLPSA
jgi:peptidoglycan/LPS O-acetylase OafA/YrhL